MGRKKLPKLEKREQVTIRLPMWLIINAKEFNISISEIAEKSLLKELKLREAEMKDNEN